jgi:hypothetical protein
MGVWILTTVVGNRFSGVYKTAEAAMQRIAGDWITIGMNRFQYTNAKGIVYHLVWWRVVTK